MTFAPRKPIPNGCTARNITSGWSVFPIIGGRTPPSLRPTFGLNTQAAFAYALAETKHKIETAGWAKQVWLADIQGPPMGCGCGNPCCRSWDNAPGPKLASTPYDRPEVLFPLEFHAALADLLPNTELIPVLCPECERSIELDGVPDPDGPQGTNLCRGVPCGDVCTRQYFPRLLAGFSQSGSAYRTAPDGGRAGKEPRGFRFTAPMGRSCVPALWHGFDRLRGT